MRANEYPVIKNQLVIGIYDKVRIFQAIFGEDKTIEMLKDCQRLIKIQK